KLPEDPIIVSLTSSPSRWAARRPLHLCRCGWRLLVLRMSRSYGCTPMPTRVAQNVARISGEVHDFPRILTTYPGTDRLFRTRQRPVPRKVPAYVPPLCDRGRFRPRV